MDITNTIIVNITECNDVIKHHSNVITIWQTSIIKVNALSKHLHLEMKGMQEREFIMGVRDR